jgi:hypothetical protein
MPKNFPPEYSRSFAITIDGESEVARSMGANCKTAKATPKNSLKGLARDWER